MSIKRGMSLIHWVLLWRAISQHLLDLQVWRPVVGPVQDSALGFVDAATLSKDDILPVNLFLTEQYSLEVNYIVHNSSHRWDLQITIKSVLHQLASLCR